MHVEHADPIPPRCTEDRNWHFLPKENTMYIRVTPYSFDAAKEQDQLGVSEQRLVPALRALPGFRRYTGAVDRPSGRGVAITEWDDLAHAQDLRDAIITVVREMAEHGLHLEAAQIFEVNAQS
jgi:hypothetical protein